MATFNIDELYRAAENSRLNALQTAQQESLNRMQWNLKDIAASYRTSVTQAQNAARISALGQEEKLAAAGLSGGSIYTSPTTGYTETSRVAADNALRSNLNNLSVQKLKAEQEARNNSASEMAQATQTYNNGMAEIKLQQAQSKIDQYNADRQYTYTVQKTAYEQAMARWETYGVVLPADAAILGVKAGTRTASSTYNNAKLALERWKATL
ncbi:MAG: hypothetical protein LUE11_08915 [Clostridia bacterium]|nr:hypothetical protein [Clostridia bacterium]